MIGIFVLLTNQSFLTLFIANTENRMSKYTHATRLRLFITAKILHKNKKKRRWNSRKLRQKTRTITINKDK